MAPKAAEKAPAKKTPAKTAEGGKKKKKVSKSETYKVRTLHGGSAWVRPAQHVFGAFWF